MATVLVDIARLLIFIASRLFLLMDAQPIGFTVDLIHRDSQASPFYNPDLTPYQRWKEAVKRSCRRTDHLHRMISLESQPYSDLYNDHGAYLMSIWFGTPPVPTLGLVDTGSNLVWTQCEPCPGCTSLALPRFDPNNSETYRTINCDSPACQLVRNSKCEVGTDNCIYSIQYGDLSYSSGGVALETVSLNSTDGTPFQFNDTIIGCSNANGGEFKKLEMGVIGLGVGPYSLISQINASVAGTFAYCLVPWGFMDKPSKVYFGSNANLSGPGVVSTKFFTRDAPKIFYLLNLEAISVGDTRLELQNYFFCNNNNRNGNMVIDSGATLTTLPDCFYYDVVDALKLSLADAEVVADPGGNFDLCYRALDGKTIANITVHFEGADVVLGRSNIFVRVPPDDYDGGLDCFTFAPTYSKFPVYGTMSQMNYLVAYDTVSKTVAFKPTDCASL